MGRGGDDVLIEGGEQADGTHRLYLLCFLGILGEHPGVFAFEFNGSRGIAQTFDLLQCSGRRHAPPVCEIFTGRWSVGGEITAGDLGKSAFGRYALLFAQPGGRSGETHFLTRSWGEAQVSLKGGGLQGHSPALEQLAAEGGGTGEASYLRRKLFASEHPAFERFAHGGGNLEEFIQGHAEIAEPGGFEEVSICAQTGLPQAILGGGK